MNKRLRAWKGEKEITDDISTANGSRSLGGYSSRDVVYREKDGTGHFSAPEFVCRIICGYPDDIAEGFRVVEEEIPD